MPSYKALSTLLPPRSILCGYHDPSFVVAVRLDNAEYVVWGGIAFGHYPLAYGRHGMKRVSIEVPGKAVDAVKSLAQRAHRITVSDEMLALLSTIGEDRDEDAREISEQLVSDSLVDASTLARVSRHLPKPTLVLARAFRAERGGTGVYQARLKTVEVKYWSIPVPPVLVEFQVKRYKVLVFNPNGVCEAAPFLYMVANILGDPHG